MTKELLLISNSTLYGGSYLQHCKENIIETLKECKKIVFIPYARPSGITHEEYTTIAQKTFKDMGYSLFGVHEHKDPVKAIIDADAIFTGGGNTFVSPITWTATQRACVTTPRAWASGWTWNTMGWAC
jgi:dipeptidase E